MEESLKTKKGKLNTEEILDILQIGTICRPRGNNVLKNSVKTWIFFFAYFHVFSFTLVLESLKVTSFFKTSGVNISAFLPNDFLRQFSSMVKL